jgi:hypothetical protein
MNATLDKLVSSRMMLLLETCDRALDTQACRAENAERRLESVRETLAAVRAQHEAIFNRYEDLKSSVHADSRNVYSSALTNTPLAFKPEIFSAPVQRANGESAVQRMRAQLEQKSALLSTPVAKRPANKLGTLSKQYI